MATKKECDRCSKQWDPTQHYGSKGDSELATVDVLAPYQSSRYDRPLISKCYELCQSCVRHIIKELESTPTQHTATVAGVNPDKYTLHTTSTAAEELKRIEEEPDE